MKTMLHLLFRLGLVVLLAVLPAACKHKELCEDHSHMVTMRVRFDWSAAPEATPRTMVLHLFAPDGSHYNRYEFSSPEGGLIRVHTGSYGLQFHNGDMEHFVERGSRYDNYEVTTDARDLLATIGRGSAAPRPEDAKGQPVRFAPESIWAGCRDRFEVTAATDQEVTLVPAEVTDFYTVEIRQVENLDKTSEIGAALTGMAESYRPSSDSPAGGPVTLPIDLTRVDSHTLSASFAAFGHCFDTTQKHTLSIYTGDKVYFHFDVTAQLHEAEDPHHVRIVIDHLKLPEPGSAGMDTSIKDWDDNVVEEDINMN